MTYPFNISANGGSPLYIRLASSMKTAIETGCLLQGEMMPSSRELSKTLGISRDTIVKSYNELIKEGLIYTQAGGGTFVRAAGTAQDSVHNNALDLTPSSALSSFARGQLRRRELFACSGDHSKINYGAMPNQFLPLGQWKELLGRHLNKKDCQALDYDSEILGFRPLREQIAMYLRRTQAVEASAEQVAIFNDSQNAIAILAQLLIDPGDRVAVENPGYGTAREVFRSYGAEVVDIDVDEEGMSVDALAAEKGPFKLVYVSPAHHDPLGIKMSLPRRHKLLLWARQNCSYIVEDAFDGEFNLGQAATPSLFQMSEDNNVIFVYSFWKTLFPLISTGCLILPADLIAAATRLKRHTDRSSSMVERCALTDFLAEGRMERYLTKLKPILRGRRNALIYELTRAFKTGIAIQKESGGLHFVAQFKIERTAKEIMAVAEECGLPLATTRNYYASNPVANEFLVSFAVIEEAAAGPLVRQFADAVLNKCDKR